MVVDNIQGNTMITAKAAEELQTKKAPLRKWPQQLCNLLQDLLALLWEGSWQEGYLDLCLAN
jgi:hypothetical protein